MLVVMKRNKRFLILVVVVVLTAILVAFFMMRNDSDKSVDENQRPEVPTAPVQSEEELNKISSSLNEFNAIILASNADEHSKVIELSKAYARDSSMGKTERMNAYVLCLDSARETNDIASTTECETELREIVQTLESDDVVLWGKLIDATKQGKALESASQDQQIQ